MRSRPRLKGAPALAALPLTALIAACSAGSPQNSFTTSNLAPVRDAPRSDRRQNDYALPPRQPDRSYARQYVDPGSPTPREYAAYDNGHNYGRSDAIQTGSLNASNRGPYPYDANARWQQPQTAVRPAPQELRPAPQELRPAPQGYAPHSPQIVEVREGDTLFGLSRRYNVPVGDLIAANRLPNERIAVGQRLVVPTRYR